MTALAPASKAAAASAGTRSLCPVVDLTDFLNQRDRGYCIGMISSRWQAKGANVCGAGGL
jgi:hypothetical protein